MCGICGVALSPRSSRLLDARLLKRMRDTMTHRGPDDLGLFLDQGVGLAHRRLSIVDIAGGHQPMHADDGSLHLVYNGEVYNHQALRASLECRGHRYRTRSDTETVLRLYQEYGPPAVHQLRGMFAFAIWDSRRRELFLARDRLGVKPLYYVHTEDGSLYFASEIKALLATGATTPALNWAELPDYLANHATSGANTLFAGVRRLLPGQTLHWHEGQIRIAQYWDLNFGACSDEWRSEGHIVAEFRERLREAVRLRLMADVPLGVFLSGGIDSTSIAALMTELVGENIKTFAVAFAEPEANELGFARAVAEQYRTDHHEVVVTPEQFFTVLPRLIWHEDEPLAHPSSVPLYFVSELASRHVKVVLTGEGSDELLAGYARYSKTLLNLALGAMYDRMTPRLLRRAVRHTIERLDVGFTMRCKLSRSFLCLDTGLESIYLDNFAVFSRSALRNLLTSETQARVGTADPYRVARAYLSHVDGEAVLNRLLYLDCKTYLHELLMKQDQMSMAASIESRVPFLDHPLVEFVAGLPTRMKLRGWRTKHVLRECMRGLVPAPILTRRKMGFPVPVGAWLRGPFHTVADEYVIGERATARGLFNPESLRRLVEEHRSGRVDHSEQLWALLNLELWQRTFLDGEQLPKMPRAVAAAAVA